MAEILPFPKKPSPGKATQGRKGAANDQETLAGQEAQVVTPAASMPGKLEHCPICQKPTLKKYSPFCSSRCWQVDLGRWLNGSYRVETEERPLEPQPGPDDQESW